MQVTFGNEFFSVPYVTCTSKMLRVAYCKEGRIDETFNRFSQNSFFQVTCTYCKGGSSREPVQFNSWFNLVKLIKNEQKFFWVFTRIRFSSMFSQPFRGSRFLIPTYCHRWCRRNVINEDEGTWWLKVWRRSKCHSPNCQLLRRQYANRPYEIAILDNEPLILPNSKVIPQIPKPWIRPWPA